MKLLAIFSLLLVLPASANAQRLLIQPEASGLMHSDAYRSYVVDTLMPALRANAPRISGVEVLAFASAETGTLNARRLVFEWGAAPKAAPFDPASLAPATLAEKLFKNAREQQIVQAREAHRREADAAERAYWDLVDAKLAAVREQLLERPSREASCVSLVDLAVRLTHTQQPQLVIGAAARACNDPRVRVASASSPVAIVLLPATFDAANSETRAFVQRQSALRPLFPGVAITTGADRQVIDVLLRVAPGEKLAVPPAEVAVATTGRAVAPGREGGGKPASPTNTSGRSTSRLPTLTEAGTSEDEAATAVGERLTKVVQELQRRYVRLSFGPYLGQCFTDQDLATFMAADVPAEAAKLARGDVRIASIVADLKTLSPRGQSAVLNFARKPLHKTWTEIGYPTPAGQTDAGVRAELLIAAAVTDMVESALREKTE